MRQRGTCKFWDLGRGYGFLTPDDGSRDVFVHVSAVERAGLRSLEKGDAVTFEVIPGKKGPQAVDIVLTEGGQNHAIQNQN